MRCRETLAFVRLCSYSMNYMFWCWRNRYRTVKALVTLPMLSESWCALVHDMDIFRMSSTDKSVRGINAASPFFETTASEHRRLESSPSPADSDPGWFAFQSWVQSTRAIR